MASNQRCGSRWTDRLTCPYSGVTSQSVLRFFETPRKAEIAAERSRERNRGEDVMKVLAATVWLARPANRMRTLSGCAPSAARKMERVSRP
jgi:hypothetical protein